MQTNRHVDIFRAISPMEALAAMMDKMERIGFEKEDTRREYRVTIEYITPEPEQPRWWLFDRDCWRVSPFTTSQSSTNGVLTVVYGTTADRDAKRDALLEAAKKAGKP